MHPNRLTIDLETSIGETLRSKVQGQIRFAAIVVMRYSDQ